MPGAVTFDAGDVNLMVAAIERRPDIGAGIKSAQRSAHKAELDAFAVEYVDDDRAKAVYYRDYARAMRLAIRITQWHHSLDGSLHPQRTAAPGQHMDAATVKQSVDLVSYIDQSAHLVKAGADRFVGVCPFHADKSPSMSVWTDGHWKCFGCGAGGDIFAFVMLQHKCGFREALQLLGGT